MNTEQIATALLLGSPVPEDVLSCYLDTAIEVLSGVHGKLGLPKTDEPFLSGKQLWTMDGRRGFGVFVGDQPDMEQHPVYGNASSSLSKYLGQGCTTVNGLYTEEDVERLCIDPEDLLLVLEFAEQFGIPEEQIVCQVGVRHTLFNCWPGCAAISQPVELRKEERI